MLLLVKFIAGLCVGALVSGIAANADLDNAGRLTGWIAPAVVLYSLQASDRYPNRADKWPQNRVWQID